MAARENDEFVSPARGLAKAMGLTVMDLYWGGQGDEYPLPAGMSGRQNEPQH